MKRGTFPTVVRIRAISMLVGVMALLGVAAQPAAAASSKGCVGGGFSLVGQGAPVGGVEVDTTVPAAQLGPTFLVKGRYVEFTVVASSFGVRDWTLTGAPNELDITGGRRTPVFDEKTPDHGGAVLTSDIAVEIKDENLEISRTGPGIAMKIQAKDCAQGGVFQMEPERADGTATVFTHMLHTDQANPAATVFYFDNPFFRARIGQVLNGVPVTARVNFANDLSPKFVGRDSTQVATRLADGCQNAFGTQCGGVSHWSVASGGRMGQVMGEDSVEVAPPATDCTQNCQAQNRVRGRFVVLGFPFPVPTESRLTPRLPS
jgi:hypothetical protein